MRKAGLVVGIFIISLMFMNSLMAQSIQRVIAVKGELAIFKKKDSEQIVKGQRFMAFRNQGSGDVQLAVVKVILTKGNLCGVKVVEPINGTRLQKGDILKYDEFEESFDFNNSPMDVKDPHVSKQTITSNILEGFAITGGVSSLGIGGGIVKRMSSKLNLRIGFHKFDYEYSDTDATKDMYFEATVNLNSVSTFVDWYPAAGRFHFSTGFMVNNNKAGLLVKSTETYEFGSTVYSADEAGVLEGVMSFDKLAPYIGIGWGNPVAFNKRLGFVFDIGAFYQNSPHVDFEATGLISPTSDQDVIVEESLEGWKAYGVVSLGLTYRFF